MKVSLIIHGSTKILNTDILAGKPYEEWLQALRLVGVELFKVSAEITKAKLELRNQNRSMPKSKWDNINKRRYELIKMWSLLADHISLVHPERINFTNNRIATLLSQRDENLYRELLTLASDDNYRVDVKGAQQ